MCYLSTLARCKKSGRLGTACKRLTLCQFAKKSPKQTWFRQNKSKTGAFSWQVFKKKTKEGFEQRGCPATLCLASFPLTLSVKRKKLDSQKCSNGWRRQTCPTSSDLSSGLLALLFKQTFRQNNRDSRFMEKNGLLALTRVEQVPRICYNLV